MCFYADYDWIAQVFEESEPVATRPVRCEECGAGIPRGATYHHVWMQQYEECRACINEECECQHLGPLSRSGAACAGMLGG